MSPRPVLVAVPDGASAEVVAAITAAITALHEEQARAAASAGSPTDTERLDDWVRASRLAARRAGMPRGSWRLAGRVERRARA